MSLQSTLDQIKADFEGGRAALKPSAADLHTMRRAMHELVASGQAGGALKAGDRAPDFELLDANNELVSSARLLQDGPLIVSFYRGVWCPYCNAELKALEQALPEFTARGAKLVAISPQTPVNSRKSVRENQLSFPILSDVKSHVAEAFGISFALPSYLVGLYKTFGNALDVNNDDPRWVLPMPARYVVAQDGTVLYAELNPDYTRRPEPSDLLPVLEHCNRFASAH